MEHSGITIVDVLLATTEPITAVLLIGILYHIRMLRKDVREELQRNRKRIQRLEETHIPDE